LCPGSWLAAKGVPRKSSCDRTPMGSSLLMGFVRYPVQGRRRTADCRCLKVYAVNAGYQGTSNALLADLTVSLGFSVAGRRPRTSLVGIEDLIKDARGPPISGGGVNAAYNVLGEHVKNGRGDCLAIDFEGGPGGTRTYRQAQLTGVKKGC
jgi:hypothetical protein